MYSYEYSRVYDVHVCVTVLCRDVCLRSKQGGPCFETSSTEDKQFYQKDVNDPMSTEVTSLCNIK